MLLIAVLRKLSHEFPVNLGTRSQVILRYRGRTCHRSGASRRKKKGRKARLASSSSGKGVYC